MDDSINTRNEAAFLADAVQRWTAELSEIDASLAAAQQRRERVAERLEHARRLLQLVKEDARASVPHPVVSWVPENAQLPLPEIAQPAHEIQTSWSWVKAVRNWIYGAPLGISHAELRDLIEKSPEFAARFHQSEKGYYHAVSRLIERDEIVRYNRRLFSTHAYDAFQREVAEGRLEDEPPISGAYSPMGEAILDLVYRNPGILGRDIIQALRTDAEFNATLTPHNSGAYNIIARLVRRKQILRSDDGKCFPGPAIPVRNPASKWLQRPSIDAREATIAAPTEVPELQLATVADTRAPSESGGNRPKRPTEPQTRGRPAHAVDLIRQMIRERPGLKAVEIVAKLQERDTPVGDRTVRSALRRLKGQEVWQRSHRWYPKHQRGSDQVEGEV
jgi:hypothetical protein